MDELLRAGLLAPRKCVPAALLYDELGSVLFEAITLLPEYEVTRVDIAMLESHAGEALTALDTFAVPLDVIELGPGHGRKARIVLERLAALQSSTRFFAVDVSAAALDACRRHLEEMTTIEFAGIEAPYIDGLARVPRAASPHRRLVLFLGSNLSNLERHESVAFLRQIRAALEPGDALLLSADLDKPPEQLLPAYDDALGVTAAFNKNVLVRLNREWGADFDVDAFAHEARWNAEARRVEMHLRALRPCAVRVARLGLELRFEAGETLWTESSHRFNLAELRGWGREAGLDCTRAWESEGWSLALLLFTAR